MPPSTSLTQGPFLSRLLAGVKLFLSTPATLRQVEGAGKILAGLVALNALLISALTALVAWGGAWIWSMDRPCCDEGVTGVLVSIALFLVLLALGAGLILLGFLVFAPLLGAPLYDLLSARVEALEGGPAPEEALSLAAWTAELAKGIGAALKSIRFFVLMSLGLLSLHLIPGIGSLAYFIASAWFGALYSTLGAMDSAAGRHGLSFKERWQLTRRHQAASIGFGISILLLMMIPVLNLFVTPLAVVGGTQLFVALRLEERENQR